MFRCYVESAGLMPEDTILDLCCGQGRHALELARRGFPMLPGLINPAIWCAWPASAINNWALHNIKEGDARRFRLARSFSCVAVMGNSFGYFEHAKTTCPCWRLSGAC